MREQKSETLYNYNPVEVKRYIAMMKEYGITTIVEMNNFLTSNMLWDHFSSIKRLNTYRNDQRETTSIGVSKEAYKAIVSMYQTHDVVNARLVEQKKI